MLFQSVFQSLINAIFYVRHSPWFGHVGTSEVWRACLLTASRWRTLRWSRVVPGGRCGGSQDRQRMITEMSQVFTSWDCWLVWNFDTFTTHITHYLNLLEWYFSCERVKCQVVFHLCSSWGWWILNNRAPVGSNSASERTQARHRVWPLFQRGLTWFDGLSVEWEGWMKSFSKTLQVYLHISAEDLYWKERNRKKSG